MQSSAHAAGVDRTSPGSLFAWSPKGLLCRRLAKGGDRPGEAHPPLFEKDQVCAIGLYLGEKMGRYKVGGGAMGAARELVELSPEGEALLGVQPRWAHRGAPR